MRSSLREIGENKGLMVAQGKFRGAPCVFICIKATENKRMITALPVLVLITPDLLDFCENEGSPEAPNVSGDIQ